MATFTKILIFWRDNHEHNTSSNSDRVAFSWNDNTESLEDERMSSEFLAGLLIGLVIGGAGMALTFCTVQALKNM